MKRGKDSRFGLHGIAKDPLHSGGGKNKLPPDKVHSEDWYTKLTPIENEFALRMLERYERRSGRQISEAEYMRIALQRMNKWVESLPTE